MLGKEHNPWMIARQNLQVGGSSGIWWSQMTCWFCDTLEVCIKNSKTLLIFLTLLICLKHIKEPCT
jgi:hypothetical protein